MRPVDHVFKQFKDYFLVYLTALLACEPNIREGDQHTFERILQSIIPDYLPVAGDLVQLTPSQQIFFSTIISKRSWNYLLNFLQSNHMQQTHHAWSTAFQRLLALKHNAQGNAHLLLSHQVQFTLSTNTNASIFPTLHQPYYEVRDIVDRCSKIADEAQRWTLLITWIQQQQQLNPRTLELVQIKVILLLNIYYDYYCQNRLDAIRSLLVVVETHLTPLPEELLVFRALIQPERSMVGYPRADVPGEVNALNRLFALHLNEEDELGIRHCMVNLMAMILLGGKESFLWTFAFEPLTLERTFGFGSTTHQVILHNAVHYDCGCLISVNGDLVQFPSRPTPGALNVPAVYVVYFATFGAMAWHLLLSEQSVDNLHGPILAKHAVADNSNIGRIAGQTLRTKVCHFVRARLISSFGFLSNRFNQDDACLLMNRSFERMAFLTMNRQQPENNWIKPVYTTLVDELNAEKQFQDHVFFHVHQKLEEFKAYINHLNLQSQIQTNLQAYIDQMPLLIQYQHFKTELHNPTYSALPLNILRYILNSPDFLSITQSIYDLSQFYLLLHQTYNLLVEREEFMTISLEELHQRGQEHYRQSAHLFGGQRNNNHKSIIDSGIKAVNNYHKFTDGLIRPGACDATQRFTQISFETPVNHLVTTGNHDDSNIIMRILSVLIDYHDGILNLLEKELNENGNGNASSLKNLVNKLTSKEVSILQIARDNTGVITLSKADFSWIEQLSRASLQDDDQGYFHTAASPLKFDFLHIQSFIIRTYLLLCRINYRHIEQRYQCHIRRREMINDFEPIDLKANYLHALGPQQLETDWNHLRQLPFDRLSQSHRFLRQIMVMINSNEQDLSRMTLYQFIDEIVDDPQLKEQMDQLEMKDFLLCYINHVQELYVNSIRDFQYLFNDVSHLLHVPIAQRVDAALIEMLQTNLVDIDYRDDVERLKSTIQTISDLLNDLRAIENSLLQRSTHPLSETCKVLEIENPILNLLTNDIKCENYVAFSIHLIRIRSVLQERAMNIKEKEQKQWFETFDEEKDVKQQQNRFQDFLNSEEPTATDKPGGEMDEDPWIETDENPAYHTAPTTDYFGEEDEMFVRRDDNRPARTTAPAVVDERIEYDSLFELHLKIVPWSFSSIFERLHQARQSLSKPAEASTKAVKVLVKHPDGKPSPPGLFKPDTLLEKLKKIFTEGKYDSKAFAIVDKDQIMVDLTGPNPRSISSEYLIIDRSLLIHVRFSLKENLMEYWTLATANLLDVIQRFIGDHQARLPSFDRSLGFFDAHGTAVPDRTVGDLVPTAADQQPHKTVDILVVDEEDQDNGLCEIRLRPRQGEEQTELFYHRSIWNQVDRWLKSNPSLENLSTHDFAYLDREKNSILDQEQSIDAILGVTKSSVIDGIREDSTINVQFSFETNSFTTRALKSVRIYQLLNNEQLGRQLNLANMSSSDFVLVPGEAKDQILSQDDLRKPVAEYLNNDNQPVHFRISLMIQIFRQGDHRSEQFPLFNTHIKLRELFEQIKGTDDRYKYLASHHTKKVVDLNGDFSALNQNKFILVEEHQICPVKIQKLIEIVLDGAQQFIGSATITDVCRAYEIDPESECLVYANDFVPSSSTSLNMLRSKLPIEFTVSNENLPIHVVIENTVTDQKAKFHCALSMSVQRLFSIACLLFGVKGKFYQLIYDDCVLDNDDQMSIEDFYDPKVSQVDLKFTSTAPMRSSIRYGQQTILVPCSAETTSTELIKEAFEYFHIPIETLPTFEFVALADDVTPIDDEFSIEDMSQLFAQLPEIIPFELQRKD